MQQTAVLMHVEAARHGELCGGEAGAGSSPHPPLSWPLTSFLRLSEQPMHHEMQATRCSHTSAFFSLAWYLALPCLLCVAYMVTLRMHMHERGAAAGLGPRHAPRSCPRHPILQAERCVLAMLLLLLLLQLPAS